MIIVYPRWVNQIFLNFSGVVNWKKKIFKFNITSIYLFQFNITYMPITCLCNFFIASLYYSFFIKQCFKEKTWISKPKFTVWRFEINGIHIFGFQIHTFIHRYFHSQKSIFHFRILTISKFKFTTFNFILPYYFNCNFILVILIFPLLQSHP